MNIFFIKCCVINWISKIGNIVLNPKKHTNNSTTPTKGLNSILCHISLCNLLKSVLFSNFKTQFKCSFKMDQFQSQFFSASHFSTSSTGTKSNFSYLPLDFFSIDALLSIDPNWPNDPVWPKVPPLWPIDPLLPLLADWPLGASSSASLLLSSSKEPPSPPLLPPRGTD